MALILVHPILVEGLNILDNISVVDAINDSGTGPEEFLEESDVVRCELCKTRVSLERRIRLGCEFCAIW